MKPAESATQPRPIELVTPEIFEPDDFYVPAVLESLIEASQSEPVHVGTVTDEEVAILDEGFDLSVDDFDGPRLSTLSEGDREVSVSAVVHLLISRGELRMQESGDFQLAGRLALLAELRGTAFGIARVHVGSRSDEAVSRWAVYRLGSRTVLLEDVFDSGVHDFFITSSTYAADFLLEKFDIKDSAQGDLESRSGSSPEEVGMDEIEAIADKRGTIVVARGNGELAEQEAFGIFACEGRLVVVRGWVTDSSGSVFVDFLGRESAEKWTAWLFGDGFGFRRE